MPTSLLSDLELLRRLIAFDSTSRFSNVPIADFICEYLDRPGIRIERQPSADGEKVNLVVIVGPEPDGSGAGLSLSGHMDVVPAEEPEWTGDPFQMREDGDRLLGRGTADMKGFVALAINTAARAAEASLKSPVALVLTFDEELGTLGARYFTEHWSIKERPLPTSMIIGEPTSLQAVRLHKGHASARLTVRGRSAHSGYPHLGHNAIEPMGRAITALTTLRHELQVEACPNGEYFPEVPFVALNLSTVNGGSAINIVPEHVELALGFRVLPGMETDELAARAEAAVSAVLDGEDWNFERLNFSPPMLMEADHSLYREVCRFSGQSDTVSASYATDGGWLSVAGFDCLLYGPGTIEVAHRPDEWLPRSEFEQCSKDLATLVRSRCQGGA
ncbi:MAG: acetylornithine deacetylase [Acidobacteriota bacterium]